MPLSDAKFAALKANLETAEKFFKADCDLYNRLIQAANEITSEKPARKEEKEGLLAQAEASKAAKEKSEAQVNSWKQKYLKALLERKKEQVTLTAEQEAELAAVAPTGAEREEPATAAAAAPAPAGGRGAHLNGEAPTGFFPSPAKLPSVEPVSITALPRCPYEEKCSASVIRELFKDSRIPPALNLLLLWLVREAAYRTVHEKHEGWGVSATYTDLDFNMSLMAKRQNLSPAEGAAIIQDVSKIDKVLQAFFQSLKGGNIQQAFSDWRRLSRELQAQFGDGGLYFQRLKSAMTEVLELFLNPTENSPGISVEDLSGAPLETVLTHPVYTFKLRILYYIASLSLQKTEEDLLGQGEFVSSLYDTLKVSVSLDACTGNFDESLKTAKSLIEVFAALRTQRDQGNGLVAAAASFLKSTVKTVAGVERQGNFGVLLKCLKAEMDGEEMAERFRAHHDAAAATRTPGAPPSS